jgi:predicted ribosome quality control (RQC) complex YloA/Tae2 family protein
MSKENSEKRLLEIPKNPPMFCMLLRKYLESSRICKVKQPDGERILEFYIEIYNDVGEKIYLCLAFEFMGKHSNVILYNHDTDVIIGCAHNVGEDKSRHREIYGGIPYVYPPKQNIESKKWKSLLDEISGYSSVNSLVDDYYSNCIAQDKFKTLKSNYKSIVSAKLKKASKTLKLMQSKFSTDEKSDKYRLYGDLLMANLYQLKDYSPSVSVFDYENNKQIEIPLDETKSLKENATKFYKLYAKSKTSRQKLSELIEEYSQNALYLEQILYSIEEANSVNDLLEVSFEVVEDTKNQKKSKQDKSIEIQHIDFEDGSKIYIGKNNKQNDYIISKLSSEDDLWFHVHNCAGSHVLLKSKNPTDEMILQCAKLAKENSRAKNSAKFGVIYTKRKYLRKPPKAALGYVTYKNETEIVV